MPATAHSVTATNITLSTGPDSGSWFRQPSGEISTLELRQDTDEPEADGALDHHALRREQTGWRGGAGEAQAAPGLTSVSPVRRQAWHPSTGRAVKRTVGHLEGVLLCGASPQLPRPGGVCRHLPAVSGWAQGPLDASPRECGCPHAPGLPARVPAPAARTHWAGPSHSVSVPCQG